MKPVDNNKELTGTLPAGVWDMIMSAVSNDLPGRLSKPILEWLVAQFEKQQQEEEGKESQEVEEL